MREAKVLATDMDGTFIPLEDNPDNRRDLETLQSKLEQLNMELLYVTGRHYELVLEAINLESLPTPNWLICDVGSSIYRRSSDCDYELLKAYSDHLASRVGTYDVDRLAKQCSEYPELTYQEPEKQGPFKLSYYCDAGIIDELEQRLSRMLQQNEAPYRIIASVDPFTGNGLIDFLPAGVSKAFALEWWTGHVGCDRTAIIFAGDSGNDVAALTAGYRSIVVGNADPSVAERAQQAHQQAGWTDRLFLAERPATSGVLEGLTHFVDGDS